ncbi:transcriptional regulator, TetR family [Dyadobacter soli]|uniref:Transcriptional regulator, TetR family n=2 Tax=Dyadobacter soli TaxID=659014 RepID=A0A1G7MI78_9BACT|nr:transcriptional regulator, TetR family [Dyadobacter soli]
MLDAVGQIISAGGTARVTTQLVADLAGVNKVLVYRYFGSVENLIEQYFTAVSDLLPPACEFLNAVDDGTCRQSEEQVLAGALKFVLCQVWENSSCQQILRREVVTGKLTSSALLDYLAIKVRSSSGSADSEPLRSSLIALVYSAICYLGLAIAHGRAVGIDLRSKGAKKKVEILIEDIVKAVLGQQC